MLNVQQTEAFHVSNHAITRQEKLIVKVTSTESKSAQKEWG